MNDNVDAAKQALDQSKFDIAFNMAQQLLVDDPSLIKGHEIAGFAANALKKWPAAEKHWMALTKIQPERLGPYSQTVTALCQQEKFELAAVFIDKTIEASPENLQFHVEKIRILQSLGQKKEARRIGLALEKRINSAEHFSTVIGLARIYSESANVPKAISLFEMAKQLLPESLDPDVYLARMAYSQGEIDEAWKRWSQLEANQKFTRPYEPALFLSRISAIRGENAGTEHYAILAMGYEAHQVEPYKILINLYFKLRDLKKARTVNEQFFENFPNNPEPFLNRSRILEYEGEPEHAATLLLEAVERWPNSRAALLAYSEHLKRNGDEDKALKFWQAQAQKNPNSVESYIQIVTLCSEQKQWKTVINYLQNSLLRIEPDHEFGILSIAAALRNSNRRDESVLYYERGCDLYPTNVNFWVGYIANKLDADQMKDVREAVKNSAKNFDVRVTRDLFSLARISVAAEEFGDAKKYLKKLLKLNPTHNQGARLLSRLLMEEGLFFEASHYVGVVRKEDWRDIEAVCNATKIKIASSLHTITQAKQNSFLAPEAIFKEIIYRGDMRTPTRPSQNAKQAMVVTSSLGSGGAERQVAATIKGLAEFHSEYIDAKLVAEDLNTVYHKDFFRADLEKSGHEVRSLQEMGGRNIARELMAQNQEHCEELSLLETLLPEVSRVSVPLYALLKMQQPNIIHTWQDQINISAGFAAVLAGVPRVVLSTRSTRPDARRRIRRYLAPGYKLLLAQPEVLMLNNSKAGARDYEDWLDLPEGTVKTIYNGMDIDLIRSRGGADSAAKVRQELGFSPTCRVLGGVMRFSEEKRPDLWVNVAIQLAKLDPEIRFVIVGDGPMRVNLTKLVAQEGLSEVIKFPGGQSPVEPWMSAMNMLFLSSRMEGLPNVLVEAQTLGVPVASMKVGGAPEALKNKVTGILFEDAEPLKIAKGILQKFKNDQWMQKASQEAGRFAEENFSIERMAKQTLEAYRGNL